MTELTVIKQLAYIKKYIFERKMTMTKIEALKELVKDIKTNIHVVKTKEQFVEMLAAIFYFIFNIFCKQLKYVILVDPLSGLNRVFLVEFYQEYSGMPVYRFYGKNIDVNHTILLYTFLITRDQIIVTNNLFKDYFTKIEQKAFLDHEMGHIKLGHHEGQLFHGNQLVASYELAADAYAAEIHGKDVMNKGLQKMKVYCLQNYKNIVPVIEATFDYRIKALS